MIRLALALCVALAVPASAQTFLGVTLGEIIPEGLPVPVETQVEAPYANTIWRTDAGLVLTATTDVETGEVLYMELRPAMDAPDGPIPAQTLGMTLRETTRAEIHARFGSEGVVFADMGRTGVTPEWALFFTNYEIADSDVILAFAMLQPLRDASEDTAGQVPLYTISVGQGSFLAQFWGVNRGRLPGYTPIADPFTE